MKMKRVLAKDTRTALAMIKETLGDDAVILSNTKIAGEVEIVAAIDFDEKRLTAQRSSAFSDRLSANLDRIKSQRNQKPNQSSASSVKVAAELNRSRSAKNPTASFNHQAPSNDNMIRMEKEMGLLRLLVEQQMSQSPNQNHTFTNAAGLKVFQRLERMGFEKRMIDPMLSELPQCDDADLLWTHAQQWLQDHLTTSSEGVVHEVGI